jgi:hypothetical protein
MLDESSRQHRGKKSCTMKIWAICHFPSTNERVTSKNGRKFPPTPWQKIVHHENMGHLPFPLDHRKGDIKKRAKVPANTVAKNRAP